MAIQTAEEHRLEEALTHRVHWRRWGPYLSDRQWGTVREDYSSDGTAWDYFSHEQARSQAYRWGEDGIAGISDNHQRLCFALALWNGEDPILKERFFGLTGNEGNHGEDVKEYYFYLDNTPTHSYMKMLYKYPHQAYPYTQLVEENKNRNQHTLEYELINTGIFNENRYFDVFVEYAKNFAEDILIQIKVVNRGTERKTLHLLPTLFFRNTWSWNKDNHKPILQAVQSVNNLSVIEAVHPTLGKRWFYAQEVTELLFTENETNTEKLFGLPNVSPYVKDGINEYMIHGKKEAVNPQQIGTKVALHYQLNIGAACTTTIQLRLSDISPNLMFLQMNRSAGKFPFGEEFETILAKRKQEADEFYQKITLFSLTEDLQNVQRQAFAGLLWSKQYYHYIVEDWLNGDPSRLPPPIERKKGRNREWFHLYTDDILSMPDKWEYPWFAAIDLAFHAIPLAIIDPDFAKYQLDVMTREWYMHPNGQIPAYEWAFGDVNPPVHAWATWRVYQIEQKYYGRCDRQFLERVFQKLMLNFTWWVNRKDVEGNNIFQGGFLGLDNIGVFDRSATLPTGGHINQSDGTSWMGMYCLNMLVIALEIAKTNPVYEDIATKFFEHFLYIANAMNHIGGDMNASLWDEEDGFFYDVLHLPTEQHLKLKVRSLVGLIPLLAIETIEPETLDLLPGFKKRLEWFIKNRPDLRRNVACMETLGRGARRLLAIVACDRLTKVLQKMLDETEFFGDYGIRAVSKYHEAHPYIYEADGMQFRVDYEPAESTSGLFGGNSNWRGPVLFPVNFLLIESLQKFHHYL